MGNDTTMVVDEAEVCEVEYSRTQRLDFMMIYIIFNNIVNGLTYSNFTNYIVGLSICIDFFYIFALLTLLSLAVTPIAAKYKSIIKTSCL